jgi:NADH-quinone oxidoreductase subunit I
MKALYNYIKDVAYAFVSLAKGLLLTLKYFVTPWKSIITEQYPDNRAHPSVTEGYAGEVILIHDENNEHKCTACTLCQLACPNNSIQIISKQIETEDGKKKKILDQWVYHLDMCTFCKQCIDACPSDAIKMINSYEMSVFDRSTLIKTLNRPGSKLKEKEKVTVKVQE